MSRVVILVGSVRKGGNTELLAGAFAEGARLHNEVEIVSVADYRIHPCTGCNCCFSNEDHVCVQNDDMALIYEKLRRCCACCVCKKAGSQFRTIPVYCRFFGKRP